MLLHDQGLQRDAETLRATTSLLPFTSAMMCGDFDIHRLPQRDVARQQCTVSRQQESEHDPSLTLQRFGLVCERCRYASWASSAPAPLFGFADATKTTYLELFGEQFANRRTDGLGRNDLQLEVYSVKMKRLLNNACAGDANGASSQSNFIRLHSDSAMAMVHRQLNLHLPEPRQRQDNNALRVCVSVFWAHHS